MLVFADGVMVSASFFPSEHAQHEANASRIVSNSSFLAVASFTVLRGGRAASESPEIITHSGENRPDGEANTGVLHGI